MQDGEAGGLLVNDGSREVLQPLVIRELPEGGRDATSPYGYAGPLPAGSDDPAFLSDALRAAAEFLAGEGTVSLFLRFHPLINTIPQDIDTIVRDGDTVTIDLYLSDDEARRQIRSDHRSQIDRARRAGHRAVMDAGPEHEASFRQLYRETMRRVGADSFYLFDDDYFRDLREALGDQLHVAVVEIEHEVAAAALFIETPGIVTYHLSGWGERFRREAPTKLLIDEARRWASQRGHRWLHLGSGLGFANDGLFQFKAGFSKTRAPVYSLRMVLQPEEYDILVRARGGQPDPIASSGYFPAYRHPPERRVPFTAEQLSSEERP